MPLYKELELKYYAIEYNKVNASSIHNSLSRLAIPGFDNGSLDDGWAIDFNVDSSTGRLFHDGIDFSSGHPNDSWVIVLPMNGTDARGRVELLHMTLLQWEQDYEVVETDTVTLPRR